MSERSLRRIARFVAAATALAMVLALLAALSSTQPAAAATGTTFYVDSQTGDDQNSGTSPSAPWQSLAKVDATTFQPGDQILLADGSEWSGVSLAPQGSGDTSADITIGNYGSGALPRIDGAGQVADAVELFNQQHWTIQDIEVTNQAPATSTPGANLGDFRGILIGGNDGQTLTGFTVNSVFVHDVTGVDNWIGGSTSDNSPGINFDTGWDGSKNTGGIVFEGQVADPTNPGQPTVLSDMTVENSKIENTSWGGIITKQYAGTNVGAVATGWGMRTGTDDPNYHPLTNLTIENNYITQNGTPFGSNGIYVTGVENAVVQNNLVDRVGTSGIEVDFSDNTTIQHNEVEGTTVKAGGGDSNAIDTDMGTTNQIVQYNFVHNNNVGFLVFQVIFGGNSIWRYNVIANNSQKAFQLGSVSSSSAQIYNNTIYNNAPQLIFLQSNSAMYAFTNNVFYTTVDSPLMASGAGISYDNNYYGGTALPIPAGETTPITGDANFADPASTGPFGTEASGPALSAAAAWAPTSGSALIDSGTAITDNGGTDYAGSTLYNNAPDVGAFEYHSAAGVTGEAIEGTVTSTAGPVGGATVTVTTQGQTQATTTDSNGFYSVLNVPFGAADVTVAMTNFKTVSTTATVAEGDSTRVDVTLVTTLTTGTIQGQVDDDQANPLTAARVLLINGSKTVAATVTDATGAYSFKAVPPATSYTIKASKRGFRPSSITGVSVAVATSTTAAALLLTTPGGTILQTHDFNSLPNGSLASGTGGWVTEQDGGAVTVRTDTPGANQSMQITRSTNNACTSAELDFTKPLAGLVTVEADIQRTDQPGAAPADFISAPYVYGPNTTCSSTPGVAIATNQGQIVTNNGSITNVTPYTPGTWYHVVLVMDTVNQTFDLYVNGTEFLTDAPFRTSMPEIGRIAWYANSSNFGTELVDNVRVGFGLNAEQAAVPAKADLSTTQGFANGLADGFYNVQMHNWWGTNATSYSLFENGTLLYTEPLLDNGVEPQAATVTIDGRKNGTYVYTGVLTNSAGQTSTKSVTVHVTKAKPGIPVLSDPGYRGTPDTTVTTNMWSGTNATDYQLYVDGVLADDQQLTANTPHAQTATTQLTGLSVGAHQLVAVLSNQFGSTASDPLKLTVKP